MSDMDEIKEWLKVAEDDLISAKILLGNDPPILVTACFHCQQVVEKSLKALLTWKDQRFEKVHSIGYLLELCENHGFIFDYIKVKAEILTSYAVETRYPGADEISLEEAREAFDTTEIIYKFVINLLKV